MLPLLLSTAFAADQAFLYAQARVSLAVPFSYKGMAQTYSTELGIEFLDHNALGIRIIMLPDPPNVLGRDTPDLAFGPALSWSYFVHIRDQMDLYPNVGIGFAVGQSPVDHTNKVLPNLQAGLGFRGMWQVNEKTSFYVAPEVGVVPFILAPYMGLNLGLRWN